MAAISAEDRALLLRGLWLIASGAAVHLLHIEINGIEWATDVAGLALVVWAVFLLGRLDGGAEYARGMIVAKGAALAMLVSTMITRSGIGGEAGGLVWLVAGMTGAHRFCAAMQAFCRQFELPLSLQSWKTTAGATLVIWEVPMLLFLLLIVGATMAKLLLGRELTFRLQTVGWGNWLALIFFVPCVFFSISTHVMSREV
ncbi:MAG: hypothetical protein HYZ92_02160 [Candidatus Omnitrophica bacterium]|nr:hypothetical protein [Candidatus Omnitrophota bacterium]